MNILIINSAAAQGGAAAIAYGLFESLSSMSDMHPIFISGRKGKVRDILTINDTMISFLANVFMFRIFGKEGALSEKRWSRILDKYLDWADVVHLHNIHGYYLPHSVVKIIISRPTVWTLHDYWLFTGRCASPCTCGVLIDKCSKCKQLGRYPSAWFDNARKTYRKKRELIENSKVVFATPSRAAKKSMIELGLPSNRVSVIENPMLNIPDEAMISDRSHVRKSLSLPLNKKIALFVSNRVDDKGKGFAVLDNALQRLSHPSEWQLVVIGRVSGVITSAVRSNILFLGPIFDRKLLLNYFLAADIFVNPSYSETFGLVNVEALSCGCPVVCSDLPVFREIDQGGISFFEMGNAEDLAKVLTTYDPYLFSLVKRRQVASIVRKRFSMAHSTERYISLYRHAINMSDISSVMQGEDQ
jgi:glycosyltransferase involved in cell wall biosynthesis